MRHTGRMMSEVAPGAVLRFGAVGPHCPDFVEIETGETALLLEVAGRDRNRGAGPPFPA